MHTACLNALERALEGIAPPEGIAYLLCQVVPHYWIPVAASDKKWTRVPYYRLGYAFDFDSLVDKAPSKIEDDIVKLVTRGKIEAICFESSFYQEVISLGSQEGVSLSIVRSSGSYFSPLSSDARGGMHPLVQFTHRTWGDHAFNSLRVEGAGRMALTPALVAESAAQVLSDKHHFPPYFLLTDYALSVHLDQTRREEHICTNPLGYACWIRKHLANNPPPWIDVMALRSNNYSEDLRAPKEITPEQAQRYKDALGAGDVLAKRLVDDLRDDVVLVAHLDSDESNYSKVKLWTRHNRLKGSKEIIGTYSSCECPTPAKALRKLLEHGPIEGEEGKENDFLIVSWATWINAGGTPSAIHVACDTSHRLLMNPTELADKSWTPIIRPQGNPSFFPRIEVNYRSVDSGFSGATKTAVELVLDHCLTQLVGLDPKAAIKSFWQSVFTNRSKYLELFKTGSLLHDPTKWSTVDCTTLQPLTDLLISDLRLIAHLGLWSGFRECDTNLKVAYIHLANGFKEDRIASELVEFILGWPVPTGKEHLEYVDLYNCDVASFLQALYLLHNDHWELEFAELRDGVLGRSGKRGAVFAIGIVKPAERAAWCDLAQGGFRDIADESIGKTGELRSACNMLRKLAKTFGMIGPLEGKSQMSLYFEFQGGRK